MDPRAEIDAKIATRYFTSGKQLVVHNLSNGIGRAWEGTEHEGGMLVCAQRFEVVFLRPE